jgi:hypothetical protein
LPTVCPSSSAPSASPTSSPSCVVGKSHAGKEGGIVNLVILATTVIEIQMEYACLALWGQVNLNRNQLIVWNVSIHKLQHFLVAQHVFQYAYAVKSDLLVQYVVACLQQSSCAHSCRRNGLISLSILHYQLMTYSLISYIS